MATPIKFIPTTIPTGGGTSTIIVDDAMYYSVTDYMYSGTGTFSSSYTITANATPTIPLHIRVLYYGTMVLGTHTFTVFGKTLTAEQVLDGGIIIDCVYDLDAVAWRVAVLDSSKIGAEDYEGVESRSLATGGGVITLEAGVDKQYQYLTGTGTLSGNHSVTTTGDFPDGHSFFIKYNCTFVPAGNTVTIFGVSLTDSQIEAGNLMVHAYYDGTALAWRTQLYVNPATDFSTTDVVTVPVSFEATEQGANKVYVPYDFDITGAVGSVTKALANTDAGTITLNINGVAVATGVITIPLSSAIGTDVAITPSATKTGTSGSYISCVGAKVTAGGKAIVSLYLKRTA